MTTKKFFTQYDPQTRETVPSDGSNGYPIARLLEGPPRDHSDPTKPHGLQALRAQGIIPALDLIVFSLQHKLHDLQVFTKPIKDKKGTHILIISYQDSFTAEPSTEPSATATSTTAWEKETQEAEDAPPEPSAEEFSLSDWKAL